MKVQGRGPRVRQGHQVAGDGSPVVPADDDSGIGADAAGRGDEVAGRTGRLGAEEAAGQPLPIVVGVVGFALHLTANLGGPGGMWENFLYGAPIFSPLLFPNLALLAGIAVWVLTKSSINSSIP